MHNQSKWLGNYLRETRKRKGMDAVLIAQALGIHPTALRRRETGASTIPGDDIAVVLKAYGISPRQFATKLDERMQ